MSPDPDHLRVAELTLHNIECHPGGMPYERYNPGHRKAHREFAHQFLNGLFNAGYTLTTTEEA